MKTLFDLGNRWVKESDWKDLALVKFCLCAMGIMIGAALAPKYKKQALIGGSLVFAATYIPLMAQVAKIAAKMWNER